MRCHNLAVAVILVFSSAMLAQHSSVGNSGGSGGSSSSGSSGGGSHGSSSSVGGTSGTSHSSGGSFSGGSSGGGSHGSSSNVSGSSGGRNGSGLGSVSQGSSARRSSIVSAAARSGVRGNQSYTSRTIFVPDRGVQAKTPQPEKRTLLSFLRHPFRKSGPSPVPDLRYKVCFRGPCLACPPGQTRAGGGCAATVVANNAYNYCSRGEIWSGGNCLLQTRFLDDCTGFRLALDQQANRMRAAESAQGSACSAGATQDCSELTAKTQSESNLYRSLQERYRQCQLRSYSAYPNGSYGYGGQWPGWLFDPQYFGVDYR